MEESKSELLARLAFVDKSLDELEEEVGDLPQRVDEQQNKNQELENTVHETEHILEEVKEFCSISKHTLVDLKAKEEKLSEQQFKVRNNKEFDAITSEIKHVKEESKMLTEKLRQETIKEQNLERILDDQKAELITSKEQLKEIKKEMEELQGEQNEEKDELIEKRNKIITIVDKQSLALYNRVRSYHKDAAVKVKRNSCMGCYSAIPPQLIVEMRNNTDVLYTCENCARILIPEEIEVTETDVETI